MSKRSVPRKEVVGLVVEGRAEYSALPKLAEMVYGCPSLRPKSMNGCGATMDASGVARRALSHVREHLDAGVPRVVVCVDRGERKALAQTFARQIEGELKRLLVASAYESDRVSVVVADRAFEAWILADAMGLWQRKHFRRKPRQHCYEGHLGPDNDKGKVEISHLMTVEYKETRDGPRLFGLLDVPAARQSPTAGRGSVSLDLLLQAVGV